MNIQEDVFKSLSEKEQHLLLYRAINENNKIVNRLKNKLYLVNSATGFLGGLAAILSKYIFLHK